MIKVESHKRLPQGSGNGAYRPDERAIEIPTGSNGIGFKSLDQFLRPNINVKTLIDAAVLVTIAFIFEQWLKNGRKTVSVYYSRDHANATMLGHGTFRVAVEVRRYVARNLEMIPGLLQKPEELRKVLKRFEKNNQENDLAGFVARKLTRIRAFL